MDRIHGLSLTGVLAGNVRRRCRQSHKVWEQRGPQRSSSSIPHLAEGKLRQVGRKESFLEYLQAWWQTLLPASSPYRFDVRMKSLRRGKWQAFPKAIGCKWQNWNWDPGWDPGFHSFPLSGNHVVSSLQEDPCYDSSFLRIKKSFKIPQSHTPTERLQALWQRGLLRNFLGLTVTYERMTA